MKVAELQYLQSMDEETVLQLVDTAHSYLLDNKGVPLKKLAVQNRIPFSAIYSFLKGNPEKRIQELDEIQLSDNIKKALKAKVLLMYAQNFTKVGLLSTYQRELSKVSEKSNNQVAQMGQPLQYVGCQWKVNVVLSTNYANRVLRPEVQLEIFTKENRKIRMTIPVDKFEELRRQVAQLLR